MTRPLPPRAPCSCGCGCGTVFVPRRRNHYFLDDAHVARAYRARRARGVDQQALLDDWVGSGAVRRCADGSYELARST